MERKQQTINHLLLAACILLATSAQHQCFVTLMVLAIDSSVDVQLGTKQPDHQSAIKYSSALIDKRRQQVQEMKKQRVPSGPSPIGNRHPPSRP